MNAIHCMLLSVHAKNTYVRILNIYNYDGLVFVRTLKRTKFYENVCCVFESLILLRVKICLSLSETFVIFHQFYSHCFIKKTKSNNTPLQQIYCTALLIIVTK